MVSGVSEVHGLMASGVFQQRQKNVTLVELKGCLSDSKQTFGHIFGHPNETRHKR